MRGKPLSETHPELASQAVGWDPGVMSAGSHKVLPWRCAEGHSFLAPSYSRVAGTGCPYCSNKTVLPGFNDMATTHPELAAEADGWDPTTVIAGTGKQLNWRCQQGHSYPATGKSRSSVKGCPYCSNQKVLPGFNDLATTHPELAAEADGWDPTSVIAGTHGKLAWRCPLGHTYPATGNSRSSGSGCPYCSNRQVLPGFNDLATTHPELAAEADGWDPTTVMAGTHTKLAWRCQLGHSYPASGSNRSRGPGCPYCSNQKVIPGFNDLATTHPELAAEADGWDPTSVIAGTNGKLAWRCQLGHSYPATGNSRSSGSGCPYCSNRQVLPGFNDLATTHPELAAETDGWDPTTVIAGTGKQLNWRCQQGHSYPATGNSRSSGSGCPSCAPTGYDPNKEGYLYFLHHEMWGLLQIGISNVPDMRLAEHRRYGWKPLEIRGPMPGDIARGWELSILQSLQRRGVALAPEHVAGRFSGFTESWVEEDFPAKSLGELMTYVHDDEN